MVASARFAGFLREQLGPLGPVTVRRTFGKSGIFFEGVMLGMVADDALYLRVNDGNREMFAEAASSRSLNYEKGGRSIDLALWRAPDRLMDDPDELVMWSRLALAAAHRVALKRAATPKTSDPRV